MVQCRRQLQIPKQQFLSLCCSNFHGSKYPNITNLKKSVERNHVQPLSVHFKYYTFTDSFSVGLQARKEVDVYIQCSDEYDPFEFEQYASELLNATELRLQKEAIFESKFIRDVTIETARALNLNRFYLGLNDYRHFQS